MSENLNLAIDTIASAVVSRLDAIISARASILVGASSSTTSCELSQTTNTNAGEATNLNNVISAAAGPSNVCAASSNIVKCRNLEIDLDQVQSLLSLNTSKLKISQELGISRPTLNKIIREHGLEEKKYSSLSPAAIDDILISIKRQHPSSGEVMIRGHLLSKNIHIQRDKIRQSLRRIDMDGISARSRKTIQRRKYSVPCPNYLWHVDGTHKLVQWKLVVHLGIDGYSRLIVYAKCSPNNKASTVLNLFREAEERYGLPLKVRSDHGGENVGIWRRMYEKRLNAEAVIVGSSVHNQRIERLNRDVNTQVINYYFNLFSTFEEQGILDPENVTDLFSLHSAFLPIINMKLSEFVGAWNHHPISTERNQSPLQLYNANIRLLQLQLLNPLAAIEMDDIDISRISVVDVQAPQSPLLPQEQLGLEDLLRRNGSLNELPLFTMVTDYVANCLATRH